MTSGQEQVDQCSQRGADACGNQDIIGPRPALVREDLSRSSAHAPFRAVARYRIADLSARGEPDAHRRNLPRSLWPQRGLQDQTSHDRPAAGGSDTQEIGAGLERYKPTDRRIPG